MAGFRAYFEGELPDAGMSVALDAAESKHLVAALRARKGEELILFNGKGESCLASIEDPNPKAAEVLILKKRDRELPSSRIILAVGMPKGKGMDSIIRRAVEIGISEIVPLETQHTEMKLEGERAVKRLERWQKDIIEGCKQSGNLLAPKCEQILSVKEFLASVIPDSTKLIASLEEGSSQDFNIVPGITYWMIGPEGDFSPSEYAMAKEAGFKGVSLGDNVLTVETAVCYALSVTKYQLRNKSFSTE